MAAAWLAWRLACGKGGVPARHDPLLGAGLLVGAGLGAVAACSSLLAPPDTAPLGDLRRLLWGVVVWLAMLAAVRERRQADRCWFAIALAAAFAALVAMGQIAAHLAGPRTTPLALYSTIGNENGLAGYLLLAMPAVVVVGLRSRKRRWQWLAAAQAAGWR